MSKTELTNANLHEYVYSLPVSSLCSGCRFTYELEENIKVLKEFNKLKKREMKRLVNYAKPYAGMVVENYKRVLS